MAMMINQVIKGKLFPGDSKTIVPKVTIEEEEAGKKKGQKKKTKAENPCCLSNCEEEAVGRETRVVNLGLKIPNSGIRATVT